MKKVMCKIKDEFFCYLSFCRSCRYFKNNSEELVTTNMGMAKYVAAWLLIAVLAAVSVFTSRTQLPDGTPVSMDLLYTNWYMWVAALMLLVAISTRGVQSCKLMPMSHRRRMAYFMLRPLIVAAIVCICLIVLFWLVVICIAVMQKLAGGNSVCRRGYN